MSLTPEEEITSDYFIHQWRGSDSSLSARKNKTNNKEDKIMSKQEVEKDITIPVVDTGEESIPTNQWGMVARDGGMIPDNIKNEMIEFLADAVMRTVVNANMTTEAMRESFGFILFEARIAESGTFPNRYIDDYFLGENFIIDLVRIAIDPEASCRPNEKTTVDANVIRYMYDQPTKLSSVPYSDDMLKFLVQAADEYYAEAGGAPISESAPGGITTDKDDQDLEDLVNRIEKDTAEATAKLESAMEDTVNSAKTTASTHATTYGGGGSSNDISGWAIAGGIVAVAALAYGGYKLWSESGDEVFGAANLDGPSM